MQKVSKEAFDNFVEQLDCFIDYNDAIDPLTVKYIRQSDWAIVAYSFEDKGVLSYFIKEEDEPIPN